ncbi:MAG: glycosyltransferase family 39 protein, partial [Acidobacteriota bacterium]
MAGLFLVGVFLLLFSMSPGSIANQGYNGENLAVGNQVVGNLIALVSGKPSVAIDTPRHGWLGILFDLPFVLVSHAFAGPSVEASDAILSIQPVIFTSLLILVVFLWVRRLTASHTWAFLLALSCGFSTLLWPYSYIGLETTQSLALLLAAYLAVRRETQRTWMESLLFAILCGIAASVKINSIVLVPAIAFLIVVYFRRGRSTLFDDFRKDWQRLLVVVGVASSIFILNALAKMSSAVNESGIGANHLLSRLVDSPLVFLLQAYSFLASPNKGLIVFAPVVVLCLAGLPRAFRAEPALVIFTLLVLAGLIGVLSLSHFWAEESWGPRYLHAAVPLLVVCLAASKGRRPFSWRRAVPVLAASIIGVPVAFLGSLFYYGSLHGAMIEAKQSTLEAMQYDIHWNHIRFDYELLHVWLSGAVSS